MKESKPKDEKKQESASQKYLLAAIVLIIVIIVSILLFGKMRTPDELPTIDELHQKNIEGDETEYNYLYNGFSFVYANGLWYTQITAGNIQYDIPLHYGPRDVEDVEVVGDPNSWIGYTIAGFNKNASDTFRSATYLTFDPESENLQYVALANGELSVNIVKTLSMGVSPGCTKNITGVCETVPTITCNNTPAPVIYLDATGPAKVERDVNCLVIQGNGTNLLRAVDRFLYEAYGVMR